MREAAWGRGGWEEAVRLLAGALPGSMASFANHDLAQASLTTAVDHGFAPEFIASYRDHFVALNPWLDFWSALPEGVVTLSERDSPSHLFRNTEFYTDWLAPQGNAEAAAGMSFRVDDGNTIQIAWHYASANAPEYDVKAGAILEAIKPAIGEAVRSAAILRNGLERGARAGSLIEHIDGAAMILDDDRRLSMANEEAIGELRQGGVISSACDIVSFRDATAQRWLEECVYRLLRRLPVSSTTMAFSQGERIFKATLARTPYGEAADAALLIPARPRVLLVVKMLVGSATMIDVSALHTAFGLSLAETRLCEMLVNGLSLSESAKRLAVSDGTVRQRIKTIFNKTGTHRQGELVALLARFRVASQPL